MGAVYLPHGKRGDVLKNYLQWKDFVLGEKLIPGFDLFIYLFIGKERLGLFGQIN